MATPKKKPVVKAKKKKRKVVIKETVKVRQKASKTASDTMPTQIPRTNGVVFRVKARRK
jgi:hypothetical protein